MKSFYDIVSSSIETCARIPMMTSVKTDID